MTVRMDEQAVREALADSLYDLEENIELVVPVIAEQKVLGQAAAKALERAGFDWQSARAIVTIIRLYRDEHKVSIQRRQRQERRRRN